MLGMKHLILAAHNNGSASAMPAETTALLMKQGMLQQTVLGPRLTADGWRIVLKTLLRKRVKAAADLEKALDGLLAHTPAPTEESLAEHEVLLQRVQGALRCYEVARQNYDRAVRGKFGQAV